MELFVELSTINWSNKLIRLWEHSLEMCLKVIVSNNRYFSSQIIEMLKTEPVIK